MLRVGRIRESVYKRSVRKQLHRDDPAAGSSFLPLIVVEGWTLAADRVVSNLINTFALNRSRVRQISLSLSMPEGTEEAELRNFTGELGLLCRKYGILAAVEEARVVKGLPVPLINATGLGDGDPAGKAGKIRPDMDLVAVGSIACEGAAVLARDHEEELRKRFAGFYVEEAKELFAHSAMPVIRDILEGKDASGIALGQGGIFGGLWDLAASGPVGLDVDLSAIPIRQHTVEVCEFFNLNPYMLLSGGCLLLAADQGEFLVTLLREQEISAAVIGRTTSSRDRIIRYDEEIRYLEPPKTDEIYRI